MTLAAATGGSTKVLAARRPERSLAVSARARSTPTTLHGETAAPSKDSHRKFCKGAQSAYSHYFTSAQSTRSAGAQPTRYYYSSKQRRAARAAPVSRNLSAVLPPALAPREPCTRRAPREETQARKSVADGRWWSDASRHLVPTGVGRPGVLSDCGQSLATARAAVSPLR